MYVLLMKNTVIKIKNSWNGLNDRMEGTEESVNLFEYHWLDRTIEIIQSENRENRVKTATTKQLDPQGSIRPYPKI